MTLQTRISALLGVAAADASEVDASFLPPEDAENPFEAAVLAAQDGQPELNLHGLFAGVVAGQRSDGAGDLYCPGFEPDRVAVYEWHHDEPFAWSAAADSFAQLDAMLAVLAKLDELEVDPGDLLDQIDADALDQATTWEERLALVPDDDVRAALSGWPGCEPPSSFDFGVWRDLIGSLVPPGTVSVTRSDRLDRSVWIAAALSGDESRLGSAPPDAALDSLLKEQLALSEPAPCDALYWLWCAWLTGRDAAAKQWCDKLEGSPSTLLRGAVTTVRRMLGGDTRIGSVDLAGARKALVDRGVVPAGELSAEELAQRRTQVKSVVLPTLSEWNDALLSYTSAEDLETRVGAYPPSIGQLVKLRRLVGRGTVPPEVTALTELTTLECGDIPDDVAALKKLRTLRITMASKGDPCPSIGQLSNLEDLYLLSQTAIELPESWGSLTRLRRLELYADNSKIHLCSGLGQLPSLETLILDGRVDALPEDFSGANALHTVDFRNGPVPSLAPLATAPALRSLVLHPQNQKKVSADPQVELLPQLESLELAGKFADAAGLLTSVKRLPKLCRLVWEVWTDASRDLPEELVGVDVRELDLNLRLDPNWELVGRILKGAPSLRSVKLSCFSSPSGAPIENPTWPQLSEVDMSKCKGPLTDLFPTAAALPKLQRLVLASPGQMLHANKEPLTFLDGIEGCTELREALLAGYRLRPEHVEGLCKLSQLRVLDLRRTELDELPDAIGNLSNLELLDLRENPLTALPAGVGGLPLKTLLLGETRIESLDHLSVPSTLEHLDISSPALARVPSWLPELRQLTRLELGGAALDLPAALRLALELPALRVLVIRNVKREGFPVELFSFTRLDTLQLEKSNFNVNPNQVRMRLPDVALLLPP